MSEDRNPTPPVLEANELNELINAEKVGDTVFSKHWLFTTLLKLVKEVDRQSEGKEFLETDSVVDISEELQDELCELWDMSMNADVSQLLHEFKTIDLLTGVIAKTRSPRVVEIAIGTLGNMACNESICVDMATKEKFIDMVLLLLENDDSPTLVETTRLLYTCLACKQARDVWISAIKDRETVFINVQFILQSSTNNDLLKNVGEFVDKLLDVDDEMCSVWASEELIMAVLEALKQLGPKPGDTRGTYLHILQLLSTSEKGVEVLVNECQRVIPPLKKFLESMCDDEIVAIGGCESWMGSALSVLNVIFTSVPDGVKLLFADSRLFRCILKILEAMHNRLDDLKSELKAETKTNSLTKTDFTDSNSELEKSNENHTPSKESESQTEFSDEQKASKTDGVPISNDDKLDKQSTDQAKHVVEPSQDAKQESSHNAEHQISMLLNIIKGFLEDVLLAVSQESCDAAPEVLQYMNSECSRKRILCMVDILQDCDSLPVDKLKVMSKKYKLDRLVSIIERRVSLV